VLQDFSTARVVGGSVYGGAGITWHTRGPDGNHTLIDGPRLFVGKTRRLLELRDRGCAFPGCDRPPSWCHGHHIQAWIDGGPTTLANGVLLCGHHHRLIHQGAWQVRMAPDGLPEFIPPEWIDRNRNPLRNHRLRQ
jgi:HNH endonuclease